MNLLKLEVASVSQMKLIIKIHTLICIGNAKKGINGGEGITLPEIEELGVRNARVVSQSTGKSPR